MEGTDFEMPSIISSKIDQEHPFCQVSAELSISHMYKISTREQVCCNKWGVISKLHHVKLYLCHQA